MRWLAVLVVPIVLVTGCSTAAVAPPPPSPPWRHFQLGELRFTAPADWQALEVGRSVSTQEAMIGLLGSMPLDMPADIQAPFDLSEDGIGIIVTVDGNFNVRPSGSCGPFHTNADRVFAWTFEPADSDSIHLRAHITGEDSLDALAAKVVATVRPRRPGSGPVAWGRCSGRRGG